MLGTETVRNEVAKLERVKALGLLTDLFEGRTEGSVVIGVHDCVACASADHRPVHRSGEQESHD